jgi:hypothetical protein
VWTTCKSENSWPHRDSNSEFSSVERLAIRYTDCDILAHLGNEMGLKFGMYLPMFRIKLMPPSSLQSLNHEYKDNVSVQNVWAHVEDYETVVYVFYS